jgi:hypothetical protein
MASHAWGVSALMGCAIKPASVVARLAVETRGFLALLSLLSESAIGVQQARVVDARASRMAALSRRLVRSLDDPSRAAKQRTRRKATP